MIGLDVRSGNEKNLHCNVYVQILVVKDRCFTQAEPANENEGAPGQRKRQFQRLVSPVKDEYAVSHLLSEHFHALCPVR